MNLEQDATLVIGCDAKYVEQFEVTFPLWLKFWSRLRSLPWLFFYDGRHPDLKERIEAVVAKAKAHYAKTTIQAWLPPEEDQYEDQRDRMLTAWSLLPPLLVDTKYWLKIDVDAYPVRPIAGSFPLQRWFEGEPAIVGHRWGYTKHRGQKGDWFEILDHWGDATTLMHCTPPLNLRFGEQRRLGHQRIASFIAFFHTVWSQQVVSECLARSPDWTIPVPSQDTFLWYCAKRMNQKIVRVKMKKHGITNQSNFKKLQKAVRELSQ